MNFSIINSAQKNLIKFENDYQELTEKINLHLVSLVESTFGSEEKNKTWQVLLSYTNGVISQVEKVLEGLENVRFSEEEAILNEEKNRLIQNFNKLLNGFRKEKTTILRQIENKRSFVTPLRPKNFKQGYCYFCEIDIADRFTYKLEEENKRVLGIEVNEKAEFCSQECLLSYCKEYKKREELRQNEERKIKGNIESNKKLVTEIQTRMTDLTVKLNQLERRERELELTSDDSMIQKKEEKVGFFRRIAQSLRLVKKNDNLSPLERVKSQKNELRGYLKKNEEELKKALVLLSISKQVEKERQTIEKTRLLQKKENSESEEADI